MNGDYPDNEQRGIWDKLKHVLKDALELTVDVADEMRKDAEEWEKQDAEDRLQSPAAGQKHGHEAYQQREFN